jgi:hypothetical protein
MIACAGLEIDLTACGTSRTDHNQPTLRLTAAAAALSSSNASRIPGFRSIQWGFSSYELVSRTPRVGTAKSSMVHLGVGI